MLGIKKPANCDKNVSFSKNVAYEYAIVIKMGRHHPK